MRIERRKWNPDEVRQLFEINERNESGESLKELSEEFGIGLTELRDRLVEAGFRINTQEMLSWVSSEMRLRIVARYRDEGETVKGLVEDLRAQQIPWTPYMVREVLRQEGVELRKEAQSNPRKEVASLEEVARRRLEGGKMKDLAAECGVSEATLYARLREAGLFERVAKGPIKFDPHALSSIAARYAKGESLASLAEEVDTTAVTLKRHLQRAGLLVAPGDRSTELNRVIAQVPHEEVIERYEGGESVARIAADLRKRGIPASARILNKILDRHGIIRHPRQEER